MFPEALFAVRLFGTYVEVLLNYAALTKLNDE
jgi:hypothetical protein